MSHEKDKQWNEARENMRPYMAALFRQDLGIGGAEGRGYVARILDRIVRPEFEKILNSSSLSTPLMEKWSVMRLDDNGNEFTVSTDHSFSEATQKVKDLTQKGHKQTYWVQRK